MRAQEARERKPADLNKHVINLLDSFDHDSSLISSGEVAGSMSEAAAGVTKIKSIVDSQLYSGHQPNRIPTSNTSYVGSEHSKALTVKPEAPSKVPSLMATVLYPDRPSFTAVGSDSSATRHQFDQHSPRSRNSSNSGTTSTSSSSTRGFSPGRFSRPPYPRGSRW